MRSTWKWLLILGAAVVSLLLVAGIFFTGWFGLFRGFGPRISMFGRYGQIPPMMGPRMYGYPFFGAGQLGWVGLLFNLLVRLGLLALLVVGIFWLARSLFRPAGTVAAVSAAPVAPAMPVAARSCPSCGKTVQADWSHCPYCGTDLRESPPAS